MPNPGSGLGLSAGRYWENEGRRRPERGDSRCRKGWVRVGGLERDPCWNNVNVAGVLLGVRVVNFCGF